MLTVKLPIVSKTTDSCGITTYVAEKDARPADGALKKVVVKDFSQMICDMVVTAQVQVEYFTSFFSRQDGKEYNSSFYAAGSPLITGGIAKYSQLHDKSCQLDSNIVDYSVGVSIYSYLVETLNGQNMFLGSFANVFEYGLPGLMFQKTYAVTKFVSDLEGAGTYYQDNFGMFQLHLPVVAPAPNGGMRATLEVKGERNYKQDMICQNVR